jgi:predicted ATPase
MKLSIQNFKSFKDQEISFGKITLLAGSNSIGKSSVIQSLLLTRTAFETKKDNPLPLVGPFLLELGTADEIFNRDAGEVGQIRFNYKKDNKQNAFVILNIERKQNEPYIKDVYIPKDNSLGKDRFYYLNAERIGPRMNYKYISQKYPHAGYKGEVTFQLLLNPKSFIINPKRYFDSTVKESLFLQELISILWNL